MVIKRSPYKSSNSTEDKRSPNRKQFLRWSSPHRRPANLFGLRFNRAGSPTSLPEYILWSLSYPYLLLPGRVSPPTLSLSLSLSLYILLLLRYHFRKIRFCSFSENTKHRDATGSCCIISCDHSRKPIVCFREHLERTSAARYWISCHVSSRGTDSLVLLTEREQRYFPWFVLIFQK